MSIALCSQIALCNETTVLVGPRIQPMLLRRSVLRQGFIVSDYQKRFDEGIKRLAQWLKESKLKYTETTKAGSDNLPEALLGLFSGENSRKMIVKA